MDTTIATTALNYKKIGGLASSGAKAHAEAREKFIKDVKKSIDAQEKALEKLEKEEDKLSVADRKVSLLV